MDPVYEVRVQEVSGAYRVIYIAKFEQFVYVLHCFQKKTQRTSKKDVDIARFRFRDLMKEIRDEK